MVIISNNESYNILQSACIIWGFSRETEPVGSSVSHTLSPRRESCPDSGHRERRSLGQVWWEVQGQGQSDAAGKAAWAGLRISS